MKGDKIALSPKLKKKLAFNLEINIGDFIVSEGLIFNYVNYEFEGKIKKKDFELYRRYSEFAVYRKLLRKIGQAYLSLFFLLKKHMET